MPNVEPNQYSMQARQLKITYNIAGPQGQDTLRLEDGRQTRDFRGNEIRVQQTELGNLVTVTTNGSLDTQSATLSVLIPPVVLSSNGDQEAFQTVGIEAQHRTTLALPPNGPRETLEVQNLKGTASRVGAPLGARA